MRLSQAVGILRRLAVTSCLLLLSAPATAAEPSTENVPGAEPAYVRLRDHRLFAIRVARGGQSAESRALAATHALAAGLETAGPKQVHVDEDAERATLFVGTAPVLQLGPEDAAAAGDASLHIHAAAAKAILEQAVRAELKRQSLQDLV